MISQSLASLVLLNSVILLSFLGTHYRKSTLIGGERTINSVEYDTIEKPLGLPTPRPPPFAPKSECDNENFNPGGKIILCRRSPTNIVVAKFAKQGTIR